MARLDNQVAPIGNAQWDTKMDHTKNPMFTKILECKGMIPNQLWRYITGNLCMPPTVTIESLDRSWNNICCIELDSHANTKALIWWLFVIMRILLVSVIMTINLGIKYWYCWGYFQLWQSLDWGQVILLINAMPVLMHLFCTKNYISWQRQWHHTMFTEAMHYNTCWHEIKIHVNVFASDFGLIHVYPMNTNEESHKVLSPIFQCEDVPPSKVMDGMKEQIIGPFQQKHLSITWSR